jgi:N-acetyl-1-D-myo-inositol-2-amino-2-deoxy-alpha-D-glucopyranoside deacetylase
LGCLALVLAAFGAARPSAAQAPPRHLLVVTAHADDEVLMGPLIAHYARLGVRVRTVIVTQGDRGALPFSGVPSGPELAQVRARESECSARTLGIERPIQLAFGDGELGRATRPPWRYLVAVDSALRRVIAEERPDAIVSWGPEGGYGHPDHRLVGALVTQLVQAEAEGATARLYYPAYPAERAREVGAPPTTQPWSPVAGRFLPVRIPYDSTDLARTRAALACYRSQLLPPRVEGLMTWMHAVLRGHVYLRPWFGADASDDVFGTGARKRQLPHRGPRAR